MVLALLATGGYFVFFRDDGSQQQATDTTEEPGERSDNAPDAPDDQPEEAPERPDDEAEPEPSEPADPAPEPGGPALVYEPMGGEWEPSEVGFLGEALAQRVITEPDYADGHNWQAMLAAGRAMPEWVRDGDPEQTARAASQWFADNGFADAEVDISTDDEQPTDVDGHDAYLLKQQYTFSIPGLEAENETIYVVAVDLGERMDIFMAAIPETHPELEADAEQAIASLSVR